MSHDVCFFNNNRVFAQENRQMMSSLIAEEQSVIKAERQTTEIVEMLNFIGEKVVEQDAVIGNIYDIVDTSILNMKEGVKHLEKAKDRGQTTRLVFVSFVLALTFSLFA